MTDSSNMTMSSDLTGVRLETDVPGEIDSAFEEDLKRFDAGVCTAHHARSLRINVLIIHRLNQILSKISKLIVMTVLVF